jgi:hypothetical protein
MKWEPFDCAERRSAVTAEASEIPNSSWKPAQDLVGTVIGRFVGADVVSRADIRRRLQVLALDCPLHYSEEIAKAHGYETVVAPVSMYKSWSFPAYWEVGEPRPDSVEEYIMPRIPSVADVPGVGDYLVVSNVDVQFFTPIYPGDRISGESVLKSVTPKRTSVGDGAFYEVATTYTKATGEVVAMDCMTMYRYAAKEP